ncbi:MAG: hypothetical protein QGI86_24615 [Candidatus Poribacteria bacterium]|nr:hypothetical protein [Candidatus Poribacteria bacterium]MDP6750380.1 hypothetical protein [Candidatus Poribacteria bacterium]MDP6999316.1 hypothetical protein [Candidatus Poribacteria bacterium]
MGYSVAYQPLDQFLLDTKPLLVVGYQRGKKRGHFTSSTNYGVGGSHPMKYFGYQLVMRATLEGAAGFGVGLGKY